MGCTDKSFGVLPIEACHPVYPTTHLVLVMYQQFLLSPSTLLFCGCFSPVICRALFMNDPHTQVHRCSVFLSDETRLAR